MTKDISQQSNQSIDTELQTLIDEVGGVIKNIDEIYRDSSTRLDEIEYRVNESIIRVEQIYSDLDQIEKEAGDEMDKLILQQAEELAKE